MNNPDSLTEVAVHCRTGSLEIYAVHLPYSNIVHCRTGSLESHDVYSSSRQ